MEDGQWHTQRRPLTEKCDFLGTIEMSLDMSTEMSLQVIVGRKNAGQGYAGEPSLMTASPNRP